MKYRNFYKENEGINLNGSIFSDNEFNNFEIIEKLGKNENNEKIEIISDIENTDQKLLLLTTNLQNDAKVSRILEKLFSSEREKAID
jgi:hypothetical protein